MGRAAFQALFFVKAPIRGAVKTRLAADLGQEAALAVHTAMLRDMGDRLSDGGFQAAAHFTPADREEAMRALLGPGFSYVPQRGADLGERMANAFQAAFTGGAPAAVLFGGDAPGLTAAVIARAGGALASGEADAVLGQAADGGYYMIGFTRAAFVRAALSRRAFEDMPWGGPKVFARTLGRLRRAGLRVRLSPRLRDLDDAADLAALAAARHLPPLRGSRLAALMEAGFPQRGTLEDGDLSLIPLESGTG